jgi:hypothetical protein
MSKRVGTKGQHRQPKFDNILEDLREDELEFMNQRYNRELLFYRSHNNMKLQKCQDEYEEMKQRKKMICEEIYNRKIFRTSSNNENELRFYADEGKVINPNNTIAETIVYNYNETEIINLPSGTKGKKKEEKWEPEEIEQNNIVLEYTTMSEVDLSWEDWCEKKKLICRD